MKIDLNADLGEGCASDSALLQLVSSANIACGFTPAMRFLCSNACARR